MTLEEGLESVFTEDIAMYTDDRDMELIKAGIRNNDELLKEFIKEGDDILDRHQIDNCKRLYIKYMQEDLRLKTQIANRLISLK